ncbi:MAG: LuxR C-terminal-related transcriptional regulator [Actinomycetota bacterium]
MEDELQALVTGGERALEAGDWSAARDSFQAALDLQETAGALNGLGQALWWLGETHDSVAYRERAYAEFRRRSDSVQAATIALGLCVHYQANIGNAAASAGWLGRARRLVERHALDELRGWMTLLDAGQANDPTVVEQRSTEALEMARRDSDVDLELCAIAQIGSALVSQGRIPEGVTLLDEAMAGSLGGEGGDFETIVFTSCHMIGSCTRCAEFERAVQWIRAADRFVERYGCPFLYLYCRVHYGEILIAIGDWTEAEAQLTSALRGAERAQAPLHAFAAATLADLRFKQGRLEEAENLVGPLGSHGPAAYVAACLDLSRGKVSVAASKAERGLGETDSLGQAQLSELLGEAEIAKGEYEMAADRGRDLAELGGALDCHVIVARGKRLWGHALTASSNDHAGSVHLEAALSEFVRLGMPFETARTHLMLAAARRVLDPEVAVAEARAALAIFEDLGAGGGADAAAALLRDLGVKAARSGPRGLGTLTKREQEVLSLLGEGLSNPEIAERLYLSRKTVEHHVAAILSKLGVRNRAEAAAEAIRRLRRDPPRNR